MKAEVLGALKSPEISAFDENLLSHCTCTLCVSLQFAF